MAAFPQIPNVEAPGHYEGDEPVNLGQGFEDPMDPCTMCQQGQQEIQQAYNELTQTCNACQTQQNLKTLQQQGCQGCAQAQQVIQNVQQQSTGCASCGQPMTFTQMTPQSSSQQQMPQFRLNTGQPQQTSQALVQPMLTPLVGTNQQQLLTIPRQPGMTANQLPIALEMGPPPTIEPQQMLTQPSMQVSQGMPQSSLTSMPQQPTFQGMPTTALTAMPQQFTAQGMPTSTLTAPPVIQGSVGGMFTPQPAPVMQPPPVQPPAPQPSPQPAPTFNVPSLTPAQIAAAQQIAQQATPTIPINISGAQLGALGVGAGQGYGAGGGKAGPGAAGGISIGPEGQLSYSFNIAAGPGIGNTGIGGLIGGFGPGAFDVHRPDLHSGGPWHFVMPLGTEPIFNLL